MEFDGRKGGRNSDDICISFACNIGCYSNEKVNRKGRLNLTNPLNSGDVCINLPVEVLLKGKDNINTNEMEGGNHRNKVDNKVCCIIRGNNFVSLLFVFYLI